MNIFNHFFNVEVLVNSRPVKIYSHDGKLFVEARDGTEYTIKIRNNCFSRKLAECSVDGINVISGEPAGANDTGYVIASRSSYEIKGFRTSNDVVNAFKFSTKSKSYAAKSPQTGGDTSNCGVIGVRWFGEKMRPVPYIPQLPIKPWWENPHPVWGDYCGTSPRYGDTYGTYCSTIDSISTPQNLAGGKTLRACSTVASSTSFDMGTEFSQKEIIDKVTETKFEKELLEHETIIYYASRAVLKELGIELDNEVKISFPSAFPSKFCKPPVQ